MSLSAYFFLLHVFFMQFINIDILYLVKVNFVISILFKNIL